MEASTFETILCFSQAVLKIDLILNFINKKSRKFQKMENIPSKNSVK